MIKVTKSIRDKAYFDAGIGKRYSMSELPNAGVIGLESPKGASIKLNAADVVFSAPMSVSISEQIIILDEAGLVQAGKLV